MRQSLWTMVGKFLKMLNKSLLSPTISCPSTYLRERKRMFTQKLHSNIHPSIIHNCQKGENSPNICELMNEYTTCGAPEQWSNTEPWRIQYYTHKRSIRFMPQHKRRLATILSERNQSQKGICCMIPFICNIQNKQIPKSKVNCGCQGLGKGRQRKWLLMSTGFLLGGKMFWN